MYTERQGLASPVGDDGASPWHNAGAENTSNQRRSGWKPNFRRFCRLPCPAKSRCKGLHFPHQLSPVHRLKHRSPCRVSQIRSRGRIALRQRSRVLSQNFDTARYFRHSPCYRQVGEFNEPYVLRAKGGYVITGPVFVAETKPSGANQVHVPAHLFELVCAASLVKNDIGGAPQRGVGVTEIRPYDTAYLIHQTPV